MVKMSSFLKIIIVEKNRNTLSFYPQVVYSSSARELKMETTKPAKSEQEEDDIDIDAI